LRLVDLFTAARVEGTPAVDAPYAPTEWSFDDGDSSQWSAVRGVTELRVEGGSLRGRSVSEQPIVVARRTGSVPGSEVLHAVEVRVRASAGAELTVRFDSGDELSLERAFTGPAGLLGAATTPILGDEMQTYTMYPVMRLFRAGEIDHVLLTPTDAADADFEVESVRLVFLGEHLSSIPSGIGWHGASEIYRETIVSRAPEVLRFDLELPAEPALELAVATVEKGPATFRVDVTPAGSSEPITVRAVVDEPERWQSLWVDLDGLGGRRAEVALSLVASRPGAPGLWGAPAIRSQAALRDGSPQGVILIITDTLRSDHLSLHEYERDTAPALERIGRAGAWFGDAISQSTWTKVSVPSIQTSLYPGTHSVRDIPDRLPASADTIAEVYREAGYATLALTRIPFVGRFSNLQQGYEVLHERGSITAGELEPPPPSHVLADRLISWLEEHRETRFFALLHVSDPHGPFRPTRDYENAFAAPEDMERLTELETKVVPHIHHPVRRRHRAPSLGELSAAGVDPEEFVRLERDGYDGKIRGMDDALARLMDALEGLGLSENTLVAVVSDHGTEFLEHGGHSHGHSVYGELNRVPMLLWGPGRVPARGRVDATVQTIDLMPTLLELSGLPVPDVAQGRSLVPLMESAGADWRHPAITELPARSSTGRTRADMVALISDGWKLVRIDRGGRTELRAVRPPARPAEPRGRRGRAPRAGGEARRADRGLPGGDRRRAPGRRGRSGEPRRGGAGTAPQPGVRPMSARVGPVPCR
jgi:arylsulfatase A-like enzyme